MREYLCIKRKKKREYLMVLIFGNTHDFYIEKECAKKDFRRNILVDGML